MGVVVAEHSTEMGVLAASGVRAWRSALAVTAQDRSIKASLSSSYLGGEKPDSEKSKSELRKIASPSYHYAFLTGILVKPQGTKKD